MIIGYARVSTKGQLQHGNSLEDQEQKLLNAGCNKIYKEQYTGTKVDRPIFDKVLNSLKDGDTLVVTKLDRFARTTTEGITTVKKLLDRGVKVHILNMGLVENTPTGKLIFSVMCAFAEFERDMIVERTQEGKAIAKTKEGFTEGRPKKYTKTQLNMALDLLEEHSYTEVEKMTKISKATLVRAMRKRKLERLKG